MEGDLGPLATMLREGDPLPDRVRAGLVHLIEGGAAESGGYRLTMTKHPDLARASQGTAAKAKARTRGLRIASFMARNGAFEPGQHEAAVTFAMEEFALGRASIETAWAEHKDEARQRLEVHRRPISPTVLRID
jgi:hypothetical protein